MVQIFGTTTVDAFFHPDTYVDEGTPTTNYGSATQLKSELTGDNTDKFIIITINLPPAPEDAAVERDFDGITAMSLVLFHSSGLNATSRSWTCRELRNAFDEDAVDYNDFNSNKNNGIVLDILVITDTGGDSHSFDIYEIITALDTRWGGPVQIQINTSTGAQDEDDTFSSRENLTVANRPKLTVTYEVALPTAVSDLTVEPNPDDPTQPLLTWTPNEDGNFDHYEIFRKVGGGAFTQLGSDIDEQGTNGYLDDSGTVTENNLIQYDVRVVNSADGGATEASTISSNIVWMIRPDVSTFTVSDVTPDVLQELTFTVAATGIASTPTPVTNEWYEYTFGTSAQSDSSFARLRDLTRTHKYPYAGSQTPTMQIENSLGFKSDATNLTTGGPTLTVADIAPIAIISSSPVKVGFDETIRFFGDESYAPAGNKELNVINAYEWDKDHSGAFVADDTTTVPFKDYSWTSGDGAGTKVIALRVKDEDSDLSVHVELSIEVVAIATTDLDSVFSDGFEVIDTERGRTVIRQQGLEAKKVHRGSEELVSVSIAGFAFTDTDVDGTPDDIEILEDIVTNNKRVQITIYETVRFGAIERFRTHTEGGWDDKYNWTATIVLE